jgi:hypothetical protein
VVRKYTPAFEPLIFKLSLLTSNLRFSNLSFCVPAKIIKLVGLKNGGRVNPTTLITFGRTQNDEQILRFDSKFEVMCRNLLNIFVSNSKLIFRLISLNTG